MKRYIFAVLSVALLAACTKVLDTYPADQIATGNMWTSESLAEQGINGLYRNFYVDDMTTTRVACTVDWAQGIMRQNWMGLEVQSMNVGNSTNLQALTAATKTANDDEITVEWKWCYTGIHRINDAIEKLHRAGLSTEKFERFMCEARFLRAWYYTRLNQIYQGVPLYLEVISESECTRTQSTSTEVWEAVLDDLNYCINNEYCPDNTLTTYYGRPSKGAAYALRGNAYMWLAWENGEDNAYYRLAADDFEKVGECGYGLWNGAYIDFFHYDNEKDHEMVFPIQFTEDSGYCDYLQLILAGRDSYEGWSPVRPTYDFVSYYQNADGTDFDWASRIPEWNDDVFVNDISKREIFFFRDSVTVTNGTVVGDYWSTTEVALLQERVNAIGLDIFNKYYLKDGNEERIRSCYNDRDPRLKASILTPYDPYDTYRSAGAWHGDIMLGREKRWPTLDRGSGDSLDYYVGVSLENTYLYKKYVYTKPGELNERLRCPTDWPLIRYTDVYLHLAECYVHLGNLSGAVSIVNEIRARAGMPSVSVGNADQVMEAVRYERRVELCAEGVDWFDEWRWGTYKQMKFQDKDVYGTTNYWGEYDGYIFDWFYTDNMYPWSAPSSECDRNPNLKRLDGWAY